MRSAFLLSMLPLGFACTLAIAQNPLPEESLDAPEAAVWDPTSATWFVSNLGGGVSLEADGYGWIARFNRGGQLTDARWVDGLDAPTGMTVAGDILYVVDRGCLLEIDIPSAKITRRHEFEDAQMPNDVARAANGTLYVSDTVANRIYRIRPGKNPDIWIEDEALQCPNGLLVEDDRLVVAAWGPLTDRETLATKHPGTLLSVNLATKKIQPLGNGRPIANFDGIVRVGNRYFATDWTGGRLLAISENGDAEVVLSGLWQLADLGYSPEMEVLALPVMSENRVLFLHLAPLRESGQAAGPNAGR